MNDYASRIIAIDRIAGLGREKLTEFEVIAVLSAQPQAPLGSLAVNPTRPDASLAHA